MAAMRQHTLQHSQPCQMFTAEPFTMKRQTKTKQKIVERAFEWEYYYYYWYIQYMQPNVGNAMHSSGWKDTY